MSKDKFSRLANNSQLRNVPTPTPGQAQGNPVEPDYSPPATNPTDTVWVTMPDGRRIKRDEMTRMQLAAHRLGLTQEQVGALLEQGIDVLGAESHTAGQLQHQADRFISQRGPSVQDGSAPGETPEPGSAEPEPEPEPGAGSGEEEAGEGEPEVEPPDLLESLKRDYIRSAGEGIALQDEADLEMAATLGQRGTQTFDELTNSEGYKQNQYLIDELNDLYQKGGLTDVTRAQLEQNRKQALQTSMAQQGYIADDMAERGLGGGAAEAFGRFGAADAASERQQMADLEAAAFGQKSAVDALQQAGYAGDRLHDKYSGAVDKRNEYYDMNAQLQHDAASRLGRGIQEFFEFNVLESYVPRVINFDKEVEGVASGGTSRTEGYIGDLADPGDDAVGRAGTDPVGTTSGAQGASTSPGSHDTTGVPQDYGVWEAGGDWVEDHQKTRAQLEAAAIQAGGAIVTAGASEAAKQAAAKKAAEGK